MNKSGIFKDFTNLYQVSKTLRFELKPVGQTLEHIEAKGLISEDEERAEKYKKAKKLIDEYHKKFIHEALSYVDFVIEKKDKDDGEPKIRNLLEEFFSLYKQKEDVTQIQKELRQTIIKCMQNHTEFSSITKGDSTLFKGKKEDTSKLEALLDTLSESFWQESGISSKEEAKEIIKSFSQFTTYFTGFHENRKNMYSTEDQGTAVSHRLVNENLPMFIDNLGTYEKIAKTLPAEMSKMQNNFSKIFPELNMQHIFTLDYYKHVLTQDGIDTYNFLIGGFSKEGREEKIKGLNEYINLYNQTQKDKKQRLPRFKKLYKQILSDRGSLSFIPEAFEHDQEVLDAVEKFYGMYYEHIQDPAEESAISLAQLLQEMPNYNLDGIFIKNDTGLTYVSKDVYGHWQSIENAWNQEYDQQFTGRNQFSEGYFNNRTKAYKAYKSFSVSEIETLMSQVEPENQGKLVTYLQHIGNHDGKNLMEHIQEKYHVVQHLLTSQYDHNKNLSQEDKEVAKIKDFLDSFKELQLFLKPLLGAGNEPEKNERFYGVLLPIWQELDKVTPLYNKVRNYMTQKPYSKEKFKLNFENNGKFLGGWVDSKTDKSDNGTQFGGYLFRKKNSINEYDYFLGVSADTKLFRYDTQVAVNDQSDFERLDYYQAKSASVYNNLYKGDNSYIQEKEMLLVFLRDFVNESLDKNLRNDKNISKKETPSSCFKYLEENYPEEYTKILENFEFNNINKRIISGLKVAIKSLVRRVPHAKNFLEKSYTVFTEIMTDIELLTKEKVFNYFPVSQEEIDKIMSREKKTLFLFKILNKDLLFEEMYVKGLRQSRGKENLHTLYFKTLMEGNNSVFDIGTGEIFYRRKSINDTIPEGGHHAKELKDKFSYPIISNRRYRVDKFQFHISISMNYQATGKPKMNDLVNNTLRAAEDYHVIGIDRGERHLLYISVIDTYGNIVEQRSLNTIEYEINGQQLAKNYQALLHDREKKRDLARKSWNTVENIKELKAGYLSQVVYQVAELVVKYNAIVALEDLNFGFKRGRFKFEKQVYQKFEKALIDKLNYLVFKHAKEGEAGHVLSALQLTNKFESFQKLGKQSGILYYIPAWNTSKIDPTTGFVNMIDTRYTSVAKAQEFFQKFESITYNSEGYFEFQADYEKFTNRAYGTVQNWTICTYGDRIKTYRNKDDGQWKSDPVDITITEELKMLLTQYGIKYQHGENLQNAIAERSEKDFFTQLMYLLKLTLQMRNSRTGTDVDYLISPVKNGKGEFFDSRKEKAGLPKDADANGAYNIARKGLMLIERIQNSEEGDELNFAISNEDWLKYAQK